MTGVDPLTVPLTDRKVLSIFNGIEALDIRILITIQARLVCHTRIRYFFL